MIQTQSKTRTCNVAQCGGSTSICTSTGSTTQSCNNNACGEFHTYLIDIVLNRTWLSNWVALTSLNAWYLLLNAKIYHFTVKFDTLCAIVQCNTVCNLSCHCLYNMCDYTHSNFTQRCVVCDLREGSKKIKGPFRGGEGVGGNVKAYLAFL